MLRSLSLLARSLLSLLARRQRAPSVFFLRLAPTAAISISRARFFPLRPPFSRSLSRVAVSACALHPSLSLSLLIFLSVGVSVRLFLSLSRVVCVDTYIAGPRFWLLFSRLFSFTFCTVVQYRECVSVCNGKKCRVRVACVYVCVHQYMLQNVELLALCVSGPTFEERDIAARTHTVNGPRKHIWEVVDKEVM